MLASLGMVLSLVIFIIIEHAVVPRYTFATALDHAIPFMPATWVIYVLFFPFIVVACAYAQPSEFRLFKSAVLTAFILSIGCFQLFPESVPRPDPAVIENAFFRQRLTRLWALDPASNGLPSLHVSVTCLACWMLWAIRYRWFIGAIGLLICISTLTTKQHTLVDVLGGTLMAILCIALAKKFQRGELSHGRT
jgi:membrane-associated phospholipid phosphatase